MSLGTLPRPDAALTRTVGEGRLRLVAGVAPDGRTYLAERSQRFPLRLTRPLYLDPREPNMAFLYVQNPTGGLFEDDDHLVELDARPGARVHLTTQAAS
jgi:urease accessory protein